MVRAIITWSLHNRLIVLLGTLMLIAVGLYSAYHLNVEAYPDPTPPLVEVITQNPGASPEEMERLITIPIEIALNGMPGLHRLRSTTIAGLSDIKCVFTYGTDYWKARQEVINRIALITNLPQGVTPTLSPWSPTGEIVRYVLEGPGYTLNELKVGPGLGARTTAQDRARRDRCDRVWRHREAVPGAGRPMEAGSLRHHTPAARRRDLEIECQHRRRHPQPGAAVAQRARDRVARERAIDPLDPANARQRAEIVDKKLEEISNVVITHYQGTPILVSHVAMVVEGHQPRLGIIGRDAGREDRKTTWSRASC